MKSTAALVTVLVGGGLVAVVLVARSSKPLQQSSAVGPPELHNAQLAAGKRKRALLIGINNYRYPEAVPTLFGALNDVDDMRDALTAYGFRQADIRALKNQEATRQRILTEIDTHLIKGAGAGDILVLYFSGHGSQMDNPSDPTGLDNTIVPYDSRDPGARVKDITDKELNARIWLMSKAVGEDGAITVVLDSCHSGTGVKGAIVRSAPKDTRWGHMPPPPDLAGTGASSTTDRRKSGYGDPSLRYALIAGSLSQQSSYERTDKNGRATGALTYFLVQELRRLPPSKRSYRDVMEVVASEVNREFRNQLPQLEGSDRNRVVFGDESIESRQYLIARPTATQRVVELEAGSLHGTTAGSEFDLYGPEARTFAPPEVPLTRLVISKVEELKSFGQVPLNAKIPAMMRAVERKHAFPSSKTPVFYEGLARSAALQRLKAKFDTDERTPFDSVQEGRQFRFRLIEERGQVQIFGRDGEELSSSVSTADANFIDKVETRLLLWDRWFSILALYNPSSPIRLSVQLTPKGASEPLPKDELPSFTPGEDRFTLYVSTESPGRVYLYILDITSTGTVQQIYPGPGENVSIERGQVWTQTGGTSLPPGRAFVRDVFKIIATSEPTDLRFLQLETPRGGMPRGQPPSDPLGHLLFRAAMGIRGAFFATPTTWSAVDIVFDVCTTIETPANRCRR